MRRDAEARRRFLARCLYGAYGGHEVGQIVREGRERRLEVGARRGEFWRWAARGGRRKGADPEIGGEERSRRRELSEDISVERQRERLLVSWAACESN